MEKTEQILAVLIFMENITKEELAEFIVNLDNANTGLLENNKTFSSAFAELLSRAITAERELAALKERTQGVCRWRLTDDDWGVWTGDCGCAWTLNSGDPEENEMTYCPKCGKLVEQIEPDPPESA